MMQVIPKKESALNDLKILLTNQLAHWNQEVDFLAEKLESARREVYKFNNMLNEINKLIEENEKKKQEYYIKDFDKAIKKYE